MDYLAFPSNRDIRHFPQYEHIEGMTLLDYFAAKAMQGAVTGAATRKEVFLFNECADLAYEMAAAMMEARNGK
jgi:hypothetical protein